MIIYHIITIVKEILISPSKNRGKRGNGGEYIPVTLTLFLISGSLLLRAYYSCGFDIILTSECRYFYAFLCAFTCVLKTEKSLKTLRKSAISRLFQWRRRRDLIPVENIVASCVFAVAPTRCSLFSPLSHSLHRHLYALVLKAPAVCFAKRCIERKSSTSIKTRDKLAVIHFKKVVAISEIITCLR